MGRMMMARTKKGSKGVGYEYWGKRPGTSKSGGHPGKEAKKVTHRAERREAEELIRKENEEKEEK